jgi:hypothetical protein
MPVPNSNRTLGAGWAARAKPFRDGREGGAHSDDRRGPLLGAALTDPKRARDRARTSAFVAFPIGDGALRRHLHTCLNDPSRGRLVLRTDGTV